MSKEPVRVVSENQALERPPRADAARQLMEVIASNPTAGAENLKALLDGMERVTKWQAEQEFTAAFSRLKFPPIRKTAKGHSAKYAPFDEIQEVIDPILAAEGFTLTFSSGDMTPQGIPTFGLLSHVGGHSREGVIYLPPDGVATRSGGMNMNALQAIGSTTSYGMRYCAKLMLNLRFIGDDDDGNSASALVEKERAAIEDLLVEIGEPAREKLLDFVGYKAVGDIQRGAYRAAMSWLHAKRRQMGAK